jgi:Na+/proline symporter
MPATEMIVIIAGFTALALSFIQLLRLVGTAITHQTIRRAIDREPSTAEPLLERITAPRAQAADDERLAVILIAFGLALIGASVIADDTGTWMRYGIAGALFPLIVGGALWLRHYAIERAKRGEAK